MMTIKMFDINGNPIRALFTDKEVDFIQITETTDPQQDNSLFWKRLSVCHNYPDQPGNWMKSYDENGQVEWIPLTAGSFEEMLMDARGELAYNF